MENRGEAGTRQGGWRGTQRLEFFILSKLIREIVKNICHVLHTARAAGQRITDDNKTAAKSAFARAKKKVGNLPGKFA